jgi:integrase
MASIACQVDRCLKEEVLSEEEISMLKAESGSQGIKKALRPNGDPTKLLPAIIGRKTRVTYFRACRTFFKRAKDLTGALLIRDLLTHEVIMLTFSTYYMEQADGSISKLQAAIKHVYSGASKLGWVRGPSPIENDLRDAKPNHVRRHRDGYLPQDAKAIIDYLYVHSKAYALPTDIAYRCGLREDEIAGLRKSNLDPINHVLNIRGKGGRPRTVPIPSALMQQLVSMHPVNYFFTPSESWCKTFRSTVQKACSALGIDGSGVHRFRSTYAQLQYTRFRSEGMNNDEARLKVSHLLGHNRRGVTNIYVPIGFDWEEYRPYLSAYLTETER